MPTKNQQAPKDRQAGASKTSQGTHHSRVEKNNGGKSGQPTKTNGKSAKQSSGLRDDNMDDDSDSR